MGDERNAAQVLNSLSVIKRDQSLLDESMNYLFKSLSISERIRDSAGIANAFTNIAVVYAIKQDLDKAENYFKKALELWQLLDQQGNVHTVLLNLGGLLVESGKYQEALARLNRARIYFEQHGPKTELGRTYYVLGNIYLLTGALDKSEESYLISMRVFEEIGQKMRATGCLLRLSSVAQKRGNTDKAISYANEAYRRNMELGIGNMALRSLTQLSDLYEQKKDYKNALLYYKSYKQLQDSISNKERDAQIAELEAKYQNEVKERQLAATRSEVEVQALKLRRQVVQQRILIGLAAGSLLIIFLLVYQFRIKSRNNAVLRDKNDLIQRSLADKEVLLSEIHHRVKNNLQFISSMLNLQARHLKDQEALNVLRESKLRINSMALVHQKLYQEDNLTGVNMQDYLNNLLESLRHSYQVPLDKLKMETRIEPLQLDIDTAMPIGLLVNEGVTNALKYAFEPGEEGTISIQLSRVEQHLLLEISDTGKGISDVMIGEQVEKFGFRLMHSLAEKLGGGLEIRRQQGVAIRVVITRFKEV